MQNKKIYTVVGMMSGTSLDGVDLSLAQYWKDNQKWTLRILKCKTFAYNEKDLQIIKQLESNQISYLHFRLKQIQYSQIIVNFITTFLAENKPNLQNIQINFISLHGHTIFHNPSQGITVQAANLPYIAAKLKIDVIGNFRQFDVHCGGQGAPLVPYGQQLFGNNLYLNFGGIANIGYEGKGFDIVFCNIVLNQFSKKIKNQIYDKWGNIGRSGQIDKSYLNRLKTNFKNKNYLSLARQQAQELIIQIKNSQNNQELINKMRAFYQFIHQQIIAAVQKIKQQNNIPQIKVYCTGGGAYNTFLLQLLNNNINNIQFLLPEPDIIQFKEALIFGLLGVKFMEGERNCANGIAGQLVKGHWK